MLRSKDYRQRIAFKKTIEDALYIDYGSSTIKYLFHELSTLQYHSPEFLQNLDYEVLDGMFLEYASEKWISKIAANYFYQVVDGELVHIDGMGELAYALATIYSKNWDSIYNAYYESEYAPLENYDMKQKATYNSNEQHTGTDTLTKSGSETDTKSGTETTSKNGTETNTKSGTETKTQGGSETNVRSGSEQLTKAGSEATTYNSETEHVVSGFNSSDYQDANKDLHTGADGISYGKTADATSDPRMDTTTYNNVTDAKTFANRTDQLSFNQRNDQLSFNNRTDQLSFNNRQDTLTFTNREDETEYNSTMAHTGYDELTRHGNIGVTTSQQMLQSEIDLRQYNFIMQVFRDITDYLGLPIY